MERLDLFLTRITFGSLRAASAATITRSFSRQCVLFAALFVGCVSVSVSAAQALDCPFNATTPSAPGARSAAAEGALLHRYSAWQRDDALTRKIRPTADLTGSEAFIAKNLARLDVDGDGEFNRNDALIIGRFLAGFSGDALTKNVAIAAHAERKTGVAIAAYINSGCPAAAVDPVQAEALLMWRKVQSKGSCSGCHGADFFDLARIGSSQATLVRRATADGATDAEAQALVAAVAALRTRFNMPATDPLQFRPFQPGGEQLPGLRPIDRDISFANTLPAQLPLTMTARTDGLPSVNSLATAKLSLTELLAVDLRSMKIGLAYPRWSSDIFNGAAHGTLNDWVADLAREPATEADRAVWHALQDAYLRSPTDENFWSLFAAVDKYTANFTPLADLNVNGFAVRKFKSALLGQHLMRSQLAGKTTFLQGKMAFSYLETGPLRSLFKFMEFFPASDMWEVGDTTRSVLGRQITPDAGPAKDRIAALGFPPFVVDSQRADITWLDAEQELRLPWFWIGFTLEPSLKRINGSNSTKVGEYMHESLKAARMFVHDAFSQAYRMAVQGTESAANPGIRMAYAPDYGYFMAYGAEVLGWSEDRRTGEVYEQAVKDQQAGLWSQFVANNFRMNMYLYLEALQNGSARNANGTPRLTNFPLCPAKRHFDAYQPNFKTHDYALIRALAAETGVTLSCTL